MRREQPSGPSEAREHGRRSRHAIVVWIALGVAGATGAIALAITELLDGAVKGFLPTAAGWAALPCCFGALDLARKLALVVAGSMVVYAILILRDREFYLPIPGLMGLVAGLGLVFSLIWAYLQYISADFAESVGIVPSGELTTVLWLALAVLGLSTLVDLVSFWLSDRSSRGGRDRGQSGRPGVP